MKVEDKKISAYMCDNELVIEALVQDYKNYIYTIVRNNRNTLTEEDIEEVILDVFTSVWKNRDKLDVNKIMSAYIGGITKNLMKYKFRQTKFMLNIDECSEQIIDLSDVELVSIHNEREKIIYTELDNLKSEDKDIFIEYYYSGKSVKEIGIMFNMSKSKVKSKLFRMRKRLFKVLTERGYGSDGK